MNYDTVNERYYRDASFHRLTDWLLVHIKAKNFSRSDFIDAIFMAKALHYNDALKDGLITEKEYKEGINLLSLDDNECSTTPSDICMMQTDKG